jgi:tyrosyl-tRNA synthetase
VGQILDMERVEVRFNSEWMGEMSSADMVRLCSHYTVARLLERDDFAKRYKGGEAISVHEFLYPFVQAYDSVALRSDIELGGTDQTFNLLMAREVQRAYGQPAQAVLTHPLLVGLDGRDKMSKSLGNVIGITEPPEEMYGKVLSLSDTLMLDYYDLLAAGEWSDLADARRRLAEGDGNPLRFKHDLARRITARFHGDEGGERGAEHFQRVVKRKEVPDDVPETELEPGPDGDRGLLEVLVALDLTVSNSEARRLIGQKAVSVDGAVVSDPTARLAPGCYLLKVGKRRFGRARIG